MLTRSSVFLTVIFIITFLLNVSTSFANSGPSYDCKNASTEVEETICGDSHLSALDRRLSKVYRGKIAIPAIREKVISSQRIWLRTERSKCENIEEGTSDNGGPASRKSCLALVYNNRIEWLNLLKVSESEAVGKGSLKFKLMVGGQYALCRDYVEMINMVGYSDIPICKREVLPTFPGFRSVKWVQIEDKQEIQRVKEDQVRMDRKWSSSKKEKVDKFWLSEKNKMDQGDWPVLHMSRIDMDHDGQQETVYRFTVSQPHREKYDVCTQAESYFVKFDDEEKNEFIYSKGRGYANRLGNLSGQNRLFFYDNRIFQDYWRGFGARYHLIVNEVSGIPNQVCGINLVQYGAEE
ncbi:hypothetical protein Mag101_05655 [Microbulbifer agarilyticus]|uniref:Lysozyme inhibitor LprI-like N-terminal domain-containing protein n=1 Tax=Microbulbifer agarilyticus TaxID=260552 RepID=A0A1Q2M3E6_9GAMM|nr:lysozyme inhibitor LprI family protein [Microbulbifer agarilyticus]AQQ67179.1 hypothetical protein Mag101_05655 [Microbulbifer agarilyticus]